MTRGRTLLKSCQPAVFLGQTPRTRAKGQIVETYTKVEGSDWPHAMIALLGTGITTIDLEGQQQSVN